MLIYALLESAVIQRIKHAGQANMLGYNLAQIGSYGGEFDDEAFWTQTRRLPAVWVTVGGESVQAVGRRDQQYQIKGALMVGARSPRGERFARHGTLPAGGQPVQPGQAVGSYQMMDDMRRLIAGQCLGLDEHISPIKTGGVKTLYNTKIGSEGFSVLVLDFACTYTFTAERDEPGSPARPILPGVEGADQAAPPALRWIALSYMLAGSPAPEHCVTDDIVPDELMLAALDDLHTLHYWAT